ncbi:mbre TPR repeat protein [Salpingoeca rosetta]|uniref:Mbre TPR repeat protein n=1 Tax=Salpingoeca rosetta (strain ATCC 50818 / BSB-021) TaxID=946362 RepID=F2U3J2_SALR5|nr:mbre TPR repeat protein [Salpingoeca rosetta]EGD82186.1 mbre TPR repeat protein [Salpingoeca rosetta]|eukprot:XP_004996369.1 mbre TPR repeat protein [Salpingoeca rosetta]
MADNDEHRLTDGVSVETIKAFLADLKSEFPNTYTEMTTEDACKQFVVPRTQQDNCAYVDLLRKQSPERVGKATVFVSHAWRYKIADVLNVLLEFAEEQARKDGGQPVFFWFDLFMNNQNANVTANLPQEWWSTTFKESIANIGRVLLVLMPWRDPVPLTRAWCLWEIFCGISNEGTEVNIRLPKAEEKALEQAIRDDYEAVMDTLVRVQAQRAEAFNSRDKDMIFEAIQNGVGFAALNQAVKDQLREWCLEKAVAAVEAMQTRGEGNTDAFAALCSQVGIVLNTFGELDQAIAFYEKAEAVYAQAPGKERPEMAQTYGNLGNAYRRKGEQGKAIACYEKAIVIFVQTLGEEDLNTAQTYGNLANAYGDMGDYDKAIACAEKHLAAMVKQKGEDHPDTADVFVNLGVTYNDKGDHDKAIAYGEKANAIYVRTLGEEHPDTANTYVNLGLAFKNKGEYDKAIASLEKARQIFVQTLGDEHPSTAATYMNLGHAYDSSGDSSMAIAHFEKAKEIWLRTVGERHSRTADTCKHLGNAYDSIGEYARAIECYKMAKEAYVETRGESHPDTASVYGSLGSAYREKGEYDKAIAHLEKAKEVFTATLGSSSPATAAVSMNLGIAYSDSGDREQACAHIEHALEVFTATLGPDHPNTRQAAYSLQQVRSGGAMSSHDCATLVLCSPCILVAFPFVCIYRCAQHMCTCGRGGERGE